MRIIHKSAMVGFVFLLIMMLNTPYALAVVTAQVWSTDSLGNPKSTFLPCEEVYVKGSGFLAIHDVTIYIIPDGKDPLPGNSVASGTATTNAAGEIPKTFLWSPPLTLGQYDIWVDVNQNGIFDVYYDDLNDQAIDIYAFNVIPEVPFGTAMTFLSMIVALVGFAGLRRFRPKLKLQ